MPKGEGNEGHHAGFSVAEFGYGHLQKGQAAVRKNDHRKEGDDPPAAEEGGWVYPREHDKTKPHLEHLTVSRYRETENQANLDVITKHEFMARMVCPMTLVQVVALIVVILEWHPMGGMQVVR